MKLQCRTRTLVAGAFGSTVVSAVLFGAPAIAQTSDCYVPSQSCPTPVIPSEPTANVDGTQAATSTAGSSLPFTGADVEGMAVLAGGAIVVGVVMTRARRRRDDD